LALFFGAELHEHGDIGKVADDRMFSLKIIMQPKTLGRKTLAYHVHPKLRAVLSSKPRRQCKTQMSCPVCATLCLAHQLFPFRTWQTLIVKVGARPFPAMIEETDIVVRLFERLDLSFNEAIEFFKIGLQAAGYCKIHLSLRGLSIGAQHRGAVGRVIGLVHRKLVQRCGPEMLYQRGISEGDVSMLYLRRKFLAQLSGRSTYSK
jgi:hypothetical protein